MSLTVKERIDITNAWVDACEKTNQFLMVQIGGTSLKDVIEMVITLIKMYFLYLQILPGKTRKYKGSSSCSNFTRFV